MICNDTGQRAKRLRGPIESAQVFHLVVRHFSRNIVMAITLQTGNQWNPCKDAIGTPRILHAISMKEPPEDRNKNPPPTKCEEGENRYCNDWNQKLDRPADGPNLWALLQP